MNWSLFFGFFSAVISGVIIRFWFEILNEVYLKPVRDYRLLKRKVAAALLMYTPEIFERAPISTDKSFPLSERHLVAGHAFRSLAAELEGITYSLPDANKPLKTRIRLLGKLRACIIIRIRGEVPSEDELREAVFSLVGLSNSFFLPVGKINDDGIKYNKRRVKEIRQLIGLDHNRINDEDLE
ncbi:MAG: hypothetical protein ACOX6O_05040 [Christensenellales bacterium]|jgi:hypothetical protein